jgi:CubicO group peptidase (beta-lactamase class C family)
MLSGATAVTELPQTLAGKLIADWIEVCASPNLDQKHMTFWMERHLSGLGAKRRSAATRGEYLYGVCHSNGGFRFHEINVDTLAVLVEGKETEIWYSLQFGVNAAGQLDGMGDEIVPPPEATLPKTLTDAAIGHEIGAESTRLSKADLFSGIVIVARGIKVIASSSVGYANRAGKSPITRDTQFTIGSMGKLFTAVAMGQLIDQKKASFSDTVGRFLPNYPNAVVRDQVTIGMLLSHTAGLGEFIDKRSPTMMKSGVTRAEEFLPLFDQEEPQFPPGSRWAYSNAGIALAGAIVEKVSGENYFDYIRNHIFNVAGMRDSDPNNAPRHYEHVVTPYTKMTEQGPSNDWKVADADIGSPAGGAVSTANDLLRFANALQSGKLVSRGTFDALCKPSSLSPPFFQYGYGVEIQALYGQIAVGHDGSYAGVGSDLRLFRGSPYVVIALSNQDPPSVSYGEYIAMALIAEKVKLEK